MRRYLSPSDIAASLGISRRAVYRMLQDLPRVRLGRS
ncbi:MAG: HTH domain-containing protein, partial [Deltaproteobacteria bacterium]|nr:HTH domain-containing protein [Deltaproteobacteria bacterium]